MISEKSLELNVLENIIRIVRTHYRNAFIYRFEINNNGKRDQHLKLYLLSSIINRIFNVSLIHYALPAISDTSELAVHSPNFLPRTYFIDPSRMPVETLDNNVHIVEINTHNNTAIVFSEPKRLDILDTKTFIDNIIGKKSILELSKIKELKNVQLYDYVKYFDVIDSVWQEKLKLLARTSWKLRLKGIIV